MAFYLEWDKTGEKYWETGVDRGVLFPQDPTTGVYEDGVVWNGLTSVKVTPSGGEANAQYADNIKYLNLFSLEVLHQLQQVQNFMLKLRQENHLVLHGEVR